MQQSMEYLIRDTDTLLHSPVIESLDIDFDDYTRFFIDIKGSLITYGRQQHQPKISETASRLRILQLSDYYASDTTDDLLDLTTTGSWHTHSRIGQFKDDLTANKELLEKLLLYVKNPAFQEVM